jgi:predicted nucleic acid-binding protein
MADEFVIDNSVVMAWCFQDQTNAFTEAVLDSLERFEAYVPAIWPLEVGNVLLVAERKGLLSKADVIRFLSLVRSLPIVVEQESPERMLTEILSLAREYRLSTYDASYLDLAMRLGLPLATRDKALRAAANKCKVPLVKC